MPGYVGIGRGSVSQRWVCVKSSKRLFCFGLVFPRPLVPVIESLPC
jgi:hypothetical protein